MLFQIPKESLAEIHQLKIEACRMKAIIEKSKEGTNYALSNFNIKADKGFDLVIINLMLVKRLEFKVKLTNTLANHYLNMFIGNRDFTRLQS